MSIESTSSIPASPSATVPGITGSCPECEAAVPFTRTPRRHEVCRCAGCGTELEVGSVDPLVLQLAPEIEEDWGE